MNPFDFRTPVPVIVLEDPAREAAIKKALKLSKTALAEIASQQSPKNTPDDTTVNEGINPT